MVKIWPWGVCLKVSVANPGGPARHVLGKPYFLIINSFFGKPPSGHMEAKIGHLENQKHHFEARNGPKRQKAGFGPQIFQNASPKFSFGQILFVGQSPFNKESGQTKGGPHKTPLRSYNL